MVFFLIQTKDNRKKAKFKRETEKNMRRNEPDGRRGTTPGGGRLPGARIFRLYFCSVQGQYVIRLKCYIQCNAIGARGVVDRTSVEFDVAHGLFYCQFLQLE